MFLEGKICQVCKEPLRENEEVVFCPVCGAPYHRECYNKVGKCVYEDVHGTEESYKPPVISNENEQEKIKIAEVCSNCGHEFAEDENFCPDCSAPKNVNFSFSFDVNQKKETQDKTDEDGISASKVKAFSLINANRYVNKYFSLGKQSKKSWNWAAFLVPEGWFFYRKMYKAGIVVILLLILSGVCLIPLNSILVVPEGNISSYEWVEAINKALESANSFDLGMAWFGSILSILIRVFCGLFGDYIYKCFTKEKILNYKPKSIEEENVPLFVRLSRLGGVQPFMFLVGYWATQFIPQFIQSFII